MIGIEVLRLEHLPVTVNHPDTEGAMPVGVYYRVPDEALIRRRSLNPLSDSVTCHSVTIEFPDPHAAHSAHANAMDLLNAGRSVDVGVTLFVAQKQEEAHPLRVELPVGGIRLVDDYHVEVLVYAHPESDVSRHQNEASFL